MDDSLKEVLEPLQKSIARINREIEKFKKEIEADEEDRWHELDWLYEEKGPMVEDFLGLSFVACQVYIRRVTYQLMLLHKREKVQLKTTNGTLLQCADSAMMGTRQALMFFGNSPTTTNTKMTGAMNCRKSDFHEP